LEGKWNYLYFGYRKIGKVSSAKGYCWFSESDKVEEVTFNVLHDYLIDYYHLKIGKEFKYPGFNGYLTKYKLQIGKVIY
jgi:protein transport protein SEC24